MLAGSRAGAEVCAEPANLLRVYRESFPEPCHLTLRATLGTTDVRCCQVDPSLDLWNLGAPALCLLGTGRAPWLDLPRPLGSSPAPWSRRLARRASSWPSRPGSWHNAAELPCVVQIIGGGLQSPQEWRRSRWLPWLPWLRWLPSRPRCPTLLRWRCH